MIKKLTDSNKLIGTSFFGGVIQTSFFKLVSLFGVPDIITSESKVNYEWELNCDGIPFSIYDWKMYRPLLIEEDIEWHIGTTSEEYSDIVVENLKNILK